MKKNNKKRKLLIASFAMFATALGLIVMGLHIISLPKNIILADINNLFTNISNSIDDENVITKFIKENNNINLTSKLEIANENISVLPFNNINLDFEINENREKEITKLLATVTKDGMGTANIKSFLANNNFYIGIDGITQTYLSTEQEFKSILDKTSINEEDYKTIMEAVKNTLIENTSDDEITKEKVTLADNEEVQYTKLSYPIKKTNIYTYMSKFIEKVKNNKELNKAICNTLGIEETEINKTFDDSLKEIENYKDNNEVIFYYNVYYSGFNKVVMSEIDVVSYQLSYFRDNNEKTLSLYSVDTENNLFSLTVKEKEYEGYLGGVISFNGGYDKNKFDLVLEMANEDGTKESVSVGITTETTVKNDSLETSQNILIDINTPTTIGIVGKLNVKGSSILTKGKDISIDELANSKKFEDLTEIEIQNMYNLARENTLFLSIIGAYENQL